MNRILQLAPRGIVKSGLVCAYDFAKRNLLRYSEAFDNAAWTKQGVTESGGVVSDQAIVGVHGLLQTVVISTATTYTLWAEVSKENGNLVALGFSGGADTYTDRYAIFDLNAGTVARAPTGAGTAGITALGSGKYLCWFARTGGGNNEARVMAAYASDGILNNELNRLGVGNARFRAYRAQLNEGTYPLQYEATTDNQTLIDRGPYGYHGQLGSAAGADTNDPTWTGQGLSFGGDDFVKIPAATSPLINNLSRCTVISSVNLTGWGGAGLGRISDKAFGYFRVENARLVYTQSFSIANGTWLSAASSLALSGCTVALTYDRTDVNNDPVFYVNGIQSPTAKSAMPAGSATSDASADLYLGNSAAASRNLDGTMGYYLEYNRILTPAEIMRNHQAIRADMARRGLVIAA